MLVELKNGETLNGHLVSCDTYMNLTLREVVQTSPDGDRFYRLSEAYVRGNNVRYCRGEGGGRRRRLMEGRLNTYGFQRR
ncbi:Sm-like ribonucleoprotein [Wilcoxina mikolae CBS 423.85]|nr:Sm-like ribonucleoprotein [Wilcoxina mikolae CBS 423.85]